MRAMRGKMQRYARVRSLLTTAPSCRLYYAFGGKKPTCSCRGFCEQRILTRNLTRNGAAAVVLLLSAVNFCGWSRQLNDGVRLRTRNARSLRVDDADSAQEHRVGLYASDSKPAAGLAATGPANDAAHEPAPAAAGTHTPRCGESRQPFPFSQPELPLPAICVRCAAPRGPPALG